MKIKTVLIAVAIALICSSSADAADMEGRLTSLEMRVQAMQNTRLANNQEVASAVAQVSAMQSEFGALKGGIEANRHFIGSRYDELTRQLQGLDNRIQAIEDRMMLFSGQLSKALSKLAPDVAGEGDLYQKGLDLVATANYLEAASTFSSFIKKYPKSSFVPKASFWIPECYYSAGDHRRAIKEFQTFIEKYRRSDKIPEAIYKQGESFYALGMPEEAKAFYGKVIQSYPSSSVAAQARDRIDRINKRKAEAAATPGGQSPGSYPTQTLEQRLRSQSPPVDLAPEKKERKPYRTPTGDF